MLSSFRNFAKSPIGLGLFAIIIIAFVVTLYEGQAGQQGLGSGTAIATVDGKPITEDEMIRRVRNDLEAARQENPSLDMAAFIAAGGVERSVELAVNGRALEAFARAQGMVASKKLVDGSIASIPAFAGPTGQFDRATYLALLSSRRITEVQLREDFTREALTRALIVPASGAARVPAGVVTPYASLLLEARNGAVATVPAIAYDDGRMPAPAAVEAYYRSRIANYTLPERRSLRIAAFDPKRFAEEAKPTEAEIAAEYTKRASQYAAREQRAFTQVIAPTQPAADAIVQRVRGGASLADAARAAQREAIAVPATDKAGLARLASAAVADAAFAAPRGQLAAVARSGLGFHVVLVDEVRTIAATPLTAVRGQIAADLLVEKEKRVTADFIVKVEDAIGDGSTFDEVVKRFGLAATTTLPLTSAGRPDDADVNYTIPPTVAAALADAFRAQPDDDPAVVKVGETGHVLWKLDRIVPPTPTPLAQIRDRVVRDLRLDNWSKAAKAAADRIAAAVNAGQPLATAFATLARGSGTMPPIAPVTASRIELARAQQVPPPLTTMFAIPEKRARVIPLPDRQGWWIVYLDKITRGDANFQPGLIEATQRELGQVAGSEYVEQFARAARATTGATIDAAAVARLKRQLVGAAAQ